MDLTPISAIAKTRAMRITIPPSTRRRRLLSISLTPGQAHGPVSHHADVNCLVGNVAFGVESEGAGDPLKGGGRSAHPGQFPADRLALGSHSRDHAPQQVDRVVSCRRRLVR